MEARPRIHAVESKRHLGRHKAEELAEWCGGRVGDNGRIAVPTPEGEVIAWQHDLIIKDDQGRFWVR